MSRFTANHGSRIPLIYVEKLALLCYTDFKSRYDIIFVKGVLWFDSLKIIHRFNKKKQTINAPLELFFIVLNDLFQMSMEAELL